MIIIENADANVVDRDDDKRSLDWKTVASGKDYQDALRWLIIALNDEEVNIENGWLRIYVTKQELVMNF